MSEDAAPLVATPDAPVPEGARAAWISGAGGVKLRTALFPAKGRARGSVVLSGGRTEPIEKYFELIGDLQARGFVVLAHDWRGQGLSARALADPLKGHAHGYKAYLEDFEKLLAAYQSRLPKPWIAVAHSMGGCLTLLALAHGEERFAGAIFSAPMLGVKTGKVAKPMAEAMATVNCLIGRSSRYCLGDPGKPFDDAFDGNVLTHDKKRFARHRAQIAAEPKLALGGPTWGWVDFAFRATAWLARPERLRHVTIPVIILSAEQDALVDNAAQAAAARNLPQGQFITVHGARHEILMETDDMRNIFLRAFDSLTGRTAPKPAEPPKAAAPTTASPAVPPPRPAATPAPTAAPAMAAASAAKPATAKKPAAKKKSAAKKKPAAKKAPAKSTAKPAAAKKAPAAKKPAAKKPAAKKPAGKKPAAKAAAAKKAPAAKKPVAKKAPAKKKPAAKKAAAKPAAAKKAPATKKPAAKKPSARKPAAKKPAAKKA